MRTFVSLSHSAIDEVREYVVRHGIEPRPETLAPLIRSSSPVMSHTELVAAVDEVLATFAGLGPLEDFLADEKVTDLLVNGSDDVWIDRGNGLERTHVTWKSELDLRNFAVRLAGSANRRLDEANPFVDVRLSSGIRFHALLPPLAKRTTISLRIPSKRTLSLCDLVDLGSMSPSSAQILRSIVTSGISFLICGGTGSGKTTVLSSLLSEVDPNERMVIIEDASELAVNHPHAVQLQSRLANIEGLGEVTMRTLIRQALRMRPNRIVVGEVRGIEVMDMLAALNTGHDGGCGTIHANSASSVPARIESLGLMAGIPIDAIHSEFACGIQLIIEMNSVVQGRRSVGSIAVTRLNSDRRVEVLPAVNCLNDEQYEPGYSIFQSLIKRK